MPIANQASHKVRNSYLFKEKLANITIEEDEVLVPYDVSHLFTQTLAVEAVRER